MKTNTFISAVLYYNDILTGVPNTNLSDDERKTIEKSFESLGFSSGKNSASLHSVFSGLFAVKPKEKAVWISEKPAVEAIDMFLKDIESLKVTGSLYDERVQSIGQYHFDGLAAPTDENQDVSLYSFLKTAAGFAEVSSHSESFALIGGDLSGLQSFLYDIVSKYAAKNLKGRSFYLQLLIEDVLIEVCETLEIKPWQILYSSGGGFYLFAKATKDLDKKLAQIRKDRNLSLFKAHGSALYVALDYILIDKANASGEEIGESWKSLSEKLSNAKAARYGDLMTENFQLFFGVSDSADISVDHITGRDIRDKPVNLNLKTGEETENRQVSYLTKKQIDLGRRLKNADYWLVSKNTGSKDRDTKFSFSSCKYSHEFLSKEELLKSSSTDDLISLKSFDKTNYSKAALYGYGGNRYPVLDTETGTNTNATYEHFAKSNAGEIERLGVLRMDVDNLGTAFIKGFRQRKNVFPLYSELSSRLSTFFTHRINELIANNPEFKKNIFVIYSGGDDLFAVGNWNVLIDFSNTVRIEFEKYMSGGFLTLSGGLTFVTSKYPILKAGELAGEAEERAKQFERPDKDKTKNAIDLFGTPLGWEEMAAVEAWKDEWLVWFNKNVDGINRSLLHKLFDYRERKNSKTENLRWQWHAAYSVARRSKESNQIEIDKIKKIIFKGENSYRELDLCCIGGRWADYLTRNQKN